MGYIYIYIFTSVVGILVHWQSAESRSVRLCHCPGSCKDYYTSNSLWQDPQCVSKAYPGPIRRPEDLMWPQHFISRKSLTLRMLQPYEVQGV